MATPHHSLTQPKSTLSIFIAAGGSLSIVLAVVLTVLTFISVQHYKNAARLDANSVETTARVSDVYTKQRRSGDSGRTRTTYHVSFQFDVTGTLYTHKDSVSAATYQEYEIGQVVPFWYWADDPSVAERVQGETYKAAQQTQRYSLIAGLAGLGALWWFGRKATQAVLARRFGVRTTGIVAQLIEPRHKGRRTGKGHMVFRTPDGVSGTSFTHSMRVLNGIGAGATLQVYQRKGTAFWEGDVGCRIVPPSSVPKV